MRQHNYGAAPAVSRHRHAPGCPSWLVLACALLALGSALALDESRQAADAVPPRDDGLVSPLVLDKVPGFWVEHISWEPRAVVYHNFLTPGECDYLVETAAPHVKPSVVVTESGETVVSSHRTSSGHFLSRGQDDTVTRIEERIALFSHIPAENGEALYILHYAEGQEYRGHYDYFFEEGHTTNGGQRVATMLIYLTDVEEGGETTFLNVPAPNQTGNWSECAAGKLSVRPNKGDALLFWSAKTDGAAEPASFHAGCPVIKGNKWSATKWMRMDRHIPYT